MNRRRDPKLTRGHVAMDNACARMGYEPGNRSPKPSMFSAKSSFCFGVCKWTFYNSNFVKCKIVLSADQNLNFSPPCVSDNPSWMGIMRTVPIEQSWNINYEISRSIVDPLFTQQWLLARFSWGPSCCSLITFTFWWEDSGHPALPHSFPPPLV